MEEEGREETEIRDETRKTKIDEDNHDTIREPTSPLLHSDPPPLPAPRLLCSQRGTTQFSPGRDAGFLSRWL